MLKRPTPFKMLHLLAQDDEKEARKLVAQAVEGVNKAQEQLLALEEYRHEYLKKMQIRMQNGVSSSAISNDQRFLDSIDRALAHQRDVIRTLSDKVALEKQQWMQARKKEQSMQALVNRDANRLVVLQNRLEQKQNDEFASRARNTLRMAQGM